MTREPAKNLAAPIRARLLALAQSRGQDYQRVLGRYPLCTRRLNQLPTTGLRAFTGANRNELQRRQANLDGAGQHSIAGYKFGYRHKFGLITDNYAKLLMGSHLWISEFTLDLAYLS